MIQRTRWAGWLLVGAALIFGPAWAQAQAPAPRTAQVRRETLKEPFRLAGEITPREREGVYAPELPNVQGLLVQWVAEEGSPVKAGAPLLTFADGQVRRQIGAIENRLALAKAASAKLEKQLGLERIELALAEGRSAIAVDRHKLLAIKGVGLVSALQAQKARLDLETAELNLKLARAALVAFDRQAAAMLQVERLTQTVLQKDLELAREALKSLEIRAARPGVVFYPYLRAGRSREKVGAGREVEPGELVLELLDLSQPQVVFCWRQASENRIRRNHPVTVTPWSFPGTAGKGKVTSLRWDCSLGAFSRQRGGGLRGVVSLEGIDLRLVPGMSVWVEGELQLAEAVLVVPKAAVTQQEGKHWVWVVEAKDKKRREVKIGHVTADWAEIAEGLKEGEMVILQP